MSSLASGDLTAVDEEPTQEFTKDESDANDEDEIDVEQNIQEEAEETAHEAATYYSPNSTCIENDDDDNDNNNNDTSRAPPSEQHRGEAALPPVEEEGGRSVRINPVGEIFEQSSSEKSWTTIDA
jgi:hypothetical protein